MATRRKIAAVPRELRQPIGDAGSVSRSIPPQSASQKHVEAGQGSSRRRAGKRSDPAFRPTTIFVRKETQRTATRLLEDEDTGKDFSDLVEELVASWITQHSHA